MRFTHVLPNHSFKKVAIVVVLQKTHEARLSSYQYHINGILFQLNIKRSPILVKTNLH